MKKRSYTASVAGVLFVCAMTGCGKSSDTTGTPPGSSSSSTGEPTAAMSAAVKQAEGAVAKAGTASTPDGNTLRLQGTMEVDAGQGKLALRSMATVIDAQLGEKTAAKLGTAQGQQALGSANASVQAPGGGSKPQVTGSDIQELANSMAGRTMYSSQAMYLEIIKAYGVTLDAKSDAKGGPRIQLNLTLSENDLKLTAAKASFYPDGTKSFESYEKKLQISDVTLDKLERKDDKTLVIAGSFTATELPAGVVAKQLKGQTLASVSGKFDFQEVPIRSLGGTMNQQGEAKK